MCCLLFSIPLHAARRAMAAASATALADSSSNNHFPAFNQILSPTTYGSNRGYLTSFPP